MSLLETMWDIEILAKKATKKPGHVKNLNVDHMATFKDAVTPELVLGFCSALRKLHGAMRSIHDDGCCIDLESGPNECVMRNTKMAIDALFKDSEL